MHQWKDDRPASGFTMIELLIAVVIIGILTTVAYPSYQDGVRQSRRSDGIASALGLQIAQEQFRSNCPYYAQNLGAANVCGENAGTSTVQALSESREGFYALSIQAGTASGNSYTIVIDPQGLQTDDTICNPMTIIYNRFNPDGLRAPTECW